MDVAKRVREAIAASAEARRRRDAEQREVRLRQDAEQKEARRQTIQVEGAHRRDLQRMQDQQRQQVRQLFPLLKQFRKAAFPKLRVGLAREWSWLNARVEFRRWLSSTVWGFEIRPTLNGETGTFSISPPAAWGHRGFQSVEGLSAEGVVDYLAARAEEVLDPIRDNSTVVMPPPAPPPAPTVTASAGGADWYMGITYLVAFIVWIAGIFVFTESLLTFFLWFFLGWIPSFLVALLWPLAAFLLIGYVLILLKR